MALSYVTTSGNGVTTNFAIPFSYLDRTHIHVYISDVETLSFTWVNSATIQITPAPASGTGNVEIRRVTPRDVALVDYSNGSVLFDTDLDTANLQSLFIAQEYFEQAENLFPSGHSLDSHTDATAGESTTKGAIRVYNGSGKTKALDVGAEGSFPLADPSTTTGLRYLTKGTDGQTLEVDDSVPGKLGWKQGLRKLVTTAGDLLVATASGVLARLAVGANNAVLVADTSVSSVKMAWKTTLAGLTLTSPAINTPTITSPVIDTGITGTARAGQAEIDAGTSSTHIITPNLNLISFGASGSASLTAVNLTGIPAGVRRVTLLISGLSTNGTSDVGLRIGDSGGVASSGYSGSTSTVTTGAATTNYSDRFGLTATGQINPAATLHGTITLQLVAGTTWMASGAVAWGNTIGTNVIAGSKTLTGVLDRLQIYTQNGVDTFDTGTLHITYER